MTERPGSETPPAERRGRRRSAERGGALPPEVRTVVERAARVPEGLALVRLGPPECAAVLLGVTPLALERARAALEEPRAFAEAQALVARAETRADPAPGSAPPPAPSGPEDVVAAARTRPGGLAVLASASAECAAIVLGVHPDLVLAARALAERRGLVVNLPVVDG